MGGVDIFYGPDETAERAVYYSYAVAFLICMLGLRRRNSPFLGLFEDCLNFIFGERRRIRTASHKSGHLRRFLDDMPGVVVHLHLNENIAGEEFSLRLAFFPGLDGQNLFGGDKYLANFILQP